MIGKTILHYKILKELGRGGMGAVYLAEDMELDRKVALKFLPEHYTSDPEIKSRFRREAKAAAALNHPNIVTVYEIGEHDGKSYIAMEYVQGDSLKDLISEETLTLDEVIEIVRQICDGLSKAHQAGIVHRDIKPENILMSSEGCVKIADFGLAKVKGVTRLTKEGSTMGTISYMSPEQAEGRKIDQRSDIFSLGVVIYEMLTGQLPFKGEHDLVVLYSILNEEAKPITDLRSDTPVELERIVSKTLAKEPSKRYQHIEEMLFELNRIKEISVKSQYQPVILTRTRPQLRGRMSRGLIATVSTTALLAVVLFAIFSGLLDKASNDKDQDRLLDSPDKETEAATNFGALQITSVPSGATVWLDGSLVGKTPYSDNQFKAGNHQLLLRREGYQDFSRTIHGVAGETTPIVANLAALLGELHVTSAPEAALILLDGKQIGTTPHNIQKVEAGEHTIVLQKKGFKDYSTSVTVEPAKVSQVNGKFTAVTGSLNVLVTPRGSIYIDGDLKKKDTDVQYEIDLSVGTHQVKAVHPTLGTWEKKVEIEPDRLQDIPIDFNKYVTLTVLSLDPSGKAVSGEIYIDNNSTGQTTPKQLKLRIGKHAIEVQREGYVLDDGEKVINLDDDVKEPLKFTLRKRQEDDELPVFVAYDERPEIIGGNAELNKHLRKRYPQIAREAGVEGIVIVRVIVGVDGRTESVEIIKAEPANLGFEDSAIQAIKKVSWKPAKQRGKKIRARVNMTIEFNLSAIW